MPWYIYNVLIEIPPVCPPHDSITLIEPSIVPDGSESNKVFQTNSRRIIDATKSRVSCQKGPICHA